jgi:quercetin dioxygenase-like cupin family protein
MEPARADALRISHFDALEWTNPAATESLPEHLRDVARQIRRKGLVDGENGFFASHVTMPPGHVADPHSHSHGELFVILSGSMELRAGDTTTMLAQHDAASIPAGQTYGFTIGPDGVAFLLVRTARATATIASTTDSTAASAASSAVPPA